MRLLDSRSNGLKLREFTGKDIPRYAILSHTWERDEEVTYHDISSEATDGSILKRILGLIICGFLAELSIVTRTLGLLMCGLLDQWLINSRATQKKGYSKIKNCRRQARNDGHHYLWIDTCCIDKSNHAELSEAINSMFNWYGGAEVCYVYLSDVPSSKDIAPAFKASKWFTRGWTLQELLAPREVVFYANDWTRLGSRLELSDLISSITNIDLKVLKAARHEPGADIQKVIERCSIAQRMSWASGRETQRVEDIAYSLLGIFNINMPLIYGEGPKAFRRLQIEILNKSEDQSLFAWKSSEARKTLLASSPNDFSDCGNIDGHVLNAGMPTPTSYYATNRGLCIRLKLIKCPCEQHWMGLLTCQQIRPDALVPGDTHRAGKALVGIYLEKWKHQKDLYNKVACGNECIRIVEEHSPEWDRIIGCKRQTIYIMGNGDPELWSR